MISNYTKKSLGKIKIASSFCIAVLFLFVFDPISIALIQRVAPQPVNSYITLASGTTLYDSGFLDVVLPAFTKEHNIGVRVISVGTGEALVLGQRGDVDVVLTHDRAVELKLLSRGYFTDRYDIMYNDFIILGPPYDSANIRGQVLAKDAFRKIATGVFPFVSRGDASGTKRMEMSLWEAANVEEFSDFWYRAVGQGMAATLRVASELRAYTLSDRATYFFLKNRLDLEIVLEGDPALLNQYGIMLVSQKKHPHIKHREARKLIEFLLSGKGTELISSIEVEGERMFFPGDGKCD